MVHIYAVAFFVGLALYLVYQQVSSARPRPDFRARSDRAIAERLVDDEARTLVREGYLIEAIKLVRAARGLGLKEAKDYVEALAAGRAPLVPAVVDGGGAVRSTAPTTMASQELADECRELCRAGQKIEAIKKYREGTGVGLKEAKEAVERL